MYSGGEKDNLIPVCLLTNRILVAEKPSPGLNICALKRGGGEGVRCIYFLHPMLQHKIHTCLAVCMHNVSYVIQPNKGVTYSSQFFLLSLVHVFKHVQKGMTRLKLWKPYHRRKIRNRFYSSQKKGRTKGDWWLPSNTWRPSDLFCVVPGRNATNDDRSSLRGISKPI